MYISPLPSTPKDEIMSAESVSNVFVGDPAAFNVSAQILPDP
jgi:hypothetical protein